MPSPGLSSVNNTRDYYNIPKLGEKTEGSVTLHLCLTTRLHKRGAGVGSDECVTPH